jgi:hypothetical protein
MSPKVEESAGDVWNGSTFIAVRKLSVANFKKAFVHAVDSVRTRYSCPGLNTTFE